MSATVDFGVALPPFAQGAAKRHLIDGAWVPSASGATFTTLNPSTGEGLVEIAQGGKEDVDRAVAAARRALDGPWRELKPARRQRLLLALADLVVEHYEELRLLDVFEMGAPIGSDLERSRLGAEAMADHLRYFAGLAVNLQGDVIQPSVPGSFFTYTRKEPVGVVGSIVPWNAPLATAIGKIAPVLASGCTMILKPAEEASLSPLRLGELIQELGLPEGVFNIVTGDGEVGAALTHHPGVDKIAFTGSAVTGQHIVKAAAGNLKRVSLELGGKSADIIFADADLQQAIPGASMGVFWNTGQNCCAGTRVFVERSVYDEVVEGMAAFASTLRTGNSLDPQVDIGPIVSQQQLDRVTGYLELGRQQGARAVAGGQRLTDGDLANGYFVPPTVFADVRDDMRIAEEEIFGPVVSVLPFDDVDEVIRRANLTEFGLAGGVWTTNLAKAHRVAHGIRTGVMWVNTYNQIDPAVPFGGYGMSGWGRELSAHALDEYTNVKAIWISTD